MTILYLQSTGFSIMLKQEECANAPLFVTFYKLLGF
jgi:hypothetical protein